MLFPQMFLKPRGAGGAYFPCMFFTFAARSATELVKPHVLIWGLQNAAVSIKPPAATALLARICIHFIRSELSSRLASCCILIKSLCDRMTGVSGTTSQMRKWKPRTAHGWVSITSWARGGWVMLTPSWPSTCRGLGSSRKKEGAQASENTDPPSNSSSATYSSVCVSA